MLDRKIRPLFPWFEKTKLTKRKNITIRKIHQLDTKGLDQVGEIFSKILSDAGLLTESNALKEGSYFSEKLKLKPWLNLKCVTLMDEKERCLENVNNNDSRENREALQKCRSSLLQELQFLRRTCLQQKIPAELFDLPLKNLTGTDSGSSERPIDEFFTNKRSEVKIPDKNNDNEFLCSFCAKRFSSMREMLQHKQSSHKGKLLDNSRGDLHRKSPTRGPFPTMAESHARNVSSSSKKVSAPSLSYSETRSHNTGRHDLLPSCAYPSSHYVESRSLVDSRSNRETTHHFPRHSSDSFHLEDSRKFSKRHLDDASMSPPSKYSRRDPSAYEILTDYDRMGSSSTNYHEVSEHRDTFYPPNHNSHAYEILDPGFRSINPYPSYYDQSIFNGVPSREAWNGHASTPAFVDPQQFNYARANSRSFYR